MSPELRDRVVRAMLELSGPAPERTAAETLNLPAVQESLQNAQTAAMATVGANIRR